MEGREAGFDLPLDIIYTPPGWLPPLLFASHIGALACLLAVRLPWYGKLLLAVPVIISLSFQLRRYYRESNDIPVRLILNARDQWLLIDPESKEWPARLESSSVITPGLVVLCLKTAGRRHDLILTERNTGVETLRALRVRLFYPKGQDDKI